MIEYQVSQHARDMLRERKISETWVKLAMEDPERQEMKAGGTVHYGRAIKECGGRYLRVFVSPDVKPPRIVPVFFDRACRV